MTSERHATVAMLMAVEAGAFFVGAAALHTGASVAIGPGDAREPRIVPAVIVESICCLALAFGAFGLAADRPWGRAGAMGANGVALAGTVRGIAALSAGQGSRPS